MNPEDEPILELTYEGEPFHAHRYNTAHFTFIGEHACYDHVFLHTDPEPESEIEEYEEERDYIYMFKSHSLYESTVEFIKKHNFMQHLNLVEAAEVDIEVFERSHYGDIRKKKSYPKEWNDGTASES